MPAGWSGPTWFQVHGVLALDSIEAERAIPGGRYLAAGFAAGGAATAVFVPVEPPANANPADALEAANEAFSTYGTVTQHAYLPVIAPQPPNSPVTDPGGRTIAAADIVCIAVAPVEGRPSMACVGRSDVVNVAELVQQLSSHPTG